MTVLARIYRRVDRQSRLMADMMERLGLAPADAARIDLGIPLRMACQICVYCRQGEACQAWLATCHHTAAEPPDFCPNAKFFRRVSRNQF